MTFGDIEFNPEDEQTNYLDMNQLEYEMNIPDKTTFLLIKCHFPDTSHPGAKVVGSKE